MSRFVRSPISRSNHQPRELFRRSAKRCTGYEMTGLARKYHARMRSIARLFAFAPAVVLVTSCSVIDSTLIRPADLHPAAYMPGGPAPCHSTLGSYALPKAILTVTVTGLPTSNTGNTISVTEVRRADPSLIFCLDHLADPLADHGVRIIKSSGQAPANSGLGYEVALSNGPPQTPALPALSVTTPIAKQTTAEGYGTQFLHWVVSNTVDQTAYIARSLIRAAFIGISGKPDFTPINRSLDGRADVAVTLAILDYDPFDLVQSATVNSQLRRHGYCLVLEDFTFDSRRTNVQQYCNSPTAHTHETLIFKAYVQQQREPPPRVAGVAYRPRAPYMLSIYQKADVTGRRPWVLRKTQTVYLENISPIVSVGISRSLFASRKAVLKFNEGTLVAMCLVKTSELQAAVTIPYEIIRSIVALPTAVFEVKIGNLNDNKALVQAESALISAQKDYLEFLKDKDEILTLDPTKKPTRDPLPAEFAKPAETTGIVRAQPTEIEYARNSALAQICQNAPTVFE